MTPRPSLHEIARRATLAPASGPVSFVEFVTRALRIKLTRPQWVLCVVAFDGAEPRDLTGDDRELARQLFGDVETIPPKLRAVLCAVCGARAGKTYVLGALRLLHLALTVPLGTLAPGEIAVGVFVAPDMRLAQQGLRYALGAIQEAPQLAALLEAESSERLVLKRPDGKRVALECLPATRGGSALRGRSLVGALLDEAAFFRDADYTVNDEEVFRAVAPRIVMGGQVVIASTPWAESGLLYQFFSDNYGKPTTALAAHAPTLLLRNDEHTRSYVERERQRDPDNARREFDAEFMPLGAGAFFDPRAIEHAASFARTTELVPMKLGTAAAGADFGFRSDSSGLVIAENDGQLVHVSTVLELKPEKGKPLVPSVVVKQFAEQAKRYDCPGLVSDGHYREAIREHLEPHDLAFVAAPEGLAGKVDTYTVVRTLLHEGRLRLPKHARLLQQMRDVVSKPSAGGGLQITSPRKPGVGGTGGHGDLVSALVLAVYTASKLSPPERVEHAIVDPLERAEIERFEAEQHGDVWERLLPR